MKIDDKYTAYKNVIDFLSNQNIESNTEDDKIFRRNTKEQIEKRDAHYTKLLDHFVNVTKWRNRLKEFFKWSFYVAIISSVVFLSIMMNNLFNKFLEEANIEQIIEFTPVLITSIIGFISVIITIPVTITKYLFSTKEDENITKIILHTQEHDTVGRQWATDLKKIERELIKNPGEPLQPGSMVETEESNVT